MHNYFGAENSKAMLSSSRKLCQIKTPKSGFEPATFGSTLGDAINSNQHETDLSGTMSGLATQKSLVRTHRYWILTWIEGIIICDLRTQLLEFLLHFLILLLLTSTRVCDWYLVEEINSWSVINLVPATVIILKSADVCSPRELIQV